MRKEINIPIYNQTLHLVIGECIEDIDTTKNGASFYDGDYTMWLREPPMEIEGLGTLVHESVHISKMLLNNVGVIDYNEAMAYLTQYIFTEVLKRTDI